MKIRGQNGTCIAAAQFSFTAARLMTQFRFTALGQIQFNSSNAMVINLILLNKNPLYVILSGNVDKKYCFFPNRRIIFSKQRVLMEYLKASDVTEHC